MGYQALVNGINLPSYPCFLAFARLFSVRDRFHFASSFSTSSFETLNILRMALSIRSASVLPGTLGAGSGFMYSNCGGPVLHAAWAHLAASLTNLSILGAVRRHYLEEYRGIVTSTLTVRDGALPLPPGPGLGVEVHPAVLTRRNATVERTSA